MKGWRVRNLEKCRARGRARSEEYKKKDRVRLKKRYQENKEEHLKKCKAWGEANKQRRNEITYAWIKRNKDKVNANRRRRRKEDENYRMRGRLSDRIRNALKAQTVRKKNTTAELLGCSVEFFKGYIEAQFAEGMTWKNIHIDHIRPCASFDLTDITQQKECFHYTNLRPLSAKENMLKGSLWNGKRYLKGK